MERDSSIQNASSGIHGGGVADRVEPIIYDI